jgi:hypothetical protein
MKLADFWDIARCSVVEVALMMEAIRFSETSVNIYETTWPNIPEVCHFQSFHRMCYSDISPQTINALLTSSNVRKHISLGRSPRKLIVIWVVMKFTFLYEEQRFITMFTTDRHWTISWTRSTQSIPSHVHFNIIYFNIANIVFYILILSSVIYPEVSHTVSSFRFSDQHSVCMRSRCQYFPALSRCPRFKSWPRDWSFWLTFFVLLISPSSKMSGYYLRLDHNCFVPYHFLFSENPTFGCRLHRMTYWQHVQIEREKQRFCSQI